MFSQKGQESAPFELLIAMIVMGFVIVIGFNALDRLNGETCKGNLNQNLEQLRSGIETVVKNKSKINVSFELPNCFTEEDSKLRIIERDELAYCSALCGGSQAQCTVLQFSSPSYTESKCLRISSATTFPQEPETCDPRMLEPADGYSVANWKDPERGIEIGQYTLIRQSNLFSSAPVVCAFKRV
ncbi:MAG TPA: hypothetical protein VJG83_00685 [archaeon]|nr:hypothetical protein [archaeon]